MIPRAPWLRGNHLFEPAHTRCGASACAYPLPICSPCHNPTISPLKHLAALRPICRTVPAFQDSGLQWSAGAARCAALPRHKPYHMTLAAPPPRASGGNRCHNRPGLQGVTPTVPSASSYTLLHVPSIREVNSVHRVTCGLLACLPFRRPT